MTIVPRNGRFGVKLWDPAHKRYQWIGSFDTEAEALREESRHAPSGSPTVGYWGAVWLSDYAREARATRRTYRYAVAQVVRDLSALKLSDVTRVDARRLASLAAEHDARGAHDVGRRGPRRAHRAQSVDAARDAQGP